MKRLVTFDAAGTLIDHKWDPPGLMCSVAGELGLGIAADAGRSAYEEVQARFRPLQVEAEKRRDRPEIDALWHRQFGAWLGAIGEDPCLARPLLERFRERVFSPQSHVWTLYSDVEEALAGLAEAGYRLGVVSNWDHTLHTVVKNLGIYERFDFIIASLEFGAEKPDQAIFREAVRLGKVAPDQALHVGDSYEDDFLGASEAGLDSLLLDRTRAADFGARRIQSLSQIGEAIPCLS